MTQAPTARTAESRPGHLRSPSDPVGLDISLRTGSGSGRTLLSAFDHALQSAGVADFNLVTLSSVIPPGSRLRHVSNTLPGGHGDLLFCVRAEAYAEHSGDIAWAGLGWCVDETGGGLFVEHHGGSEESVVEQIELSLGDMNAKRGGWLRSRADGARVRTLHRGAGLRRRGRGVPRLELARRRAGGSRDSHHVRAGTRASAASGFANGVANDVAFDAVNGVVSDEQGSHWTDDRELVGASPLPNGAASSTEPRSDVPAVPDIRVTVEKELDYVTARRYYELYRETFGPMETKAVARQLLHESEFIEEMLDPRVLKYVAWSDDGEAIGMTTLTSDLSTVPWISAAYFAHHYPEHHARGAIYYLGFTLVHPDHQGGHVFHAMIGPMWEFVREQRPVVAWDMCMVNDERGLGGSAGRLLASFADVDIVQVDRQNYYVGNFHGPRHNPAH